MVITRQIGKLDIIISDGKEYQVKELFLIPESPFIKVLTKCGKIIQTIWIN